MKKRNKYLITVFLIIILTISIFNIKEYTDNKLIKERVEYVEKTKVDKFAHISIDDTIQLFDDIKNNNYQSIFENSFLKKLKKIHDKYGTKFSLFVFYKYDNKTIENSPTKYKQEFIKNSSWLKFGFHAYSDKSKYETDYNKITLEFDKTMEVLENVVGKEALTSVMRLDRFVLSRNNLKSINELEKRIDGLLGADSKNRPNYFLNKESNNKLFERDYLYDNETDIFFYTTDIRIENLSFINLENEMNKYKNDKNLIVFTHEWNFNYFKLDKVCKWINEHYYRYDYPKLMEE